MNQKESSFYLETLSQLKNILPTHNIDLNPNKTKTLIKTESILVIDNNPNLLDSIRFFEVISIDYTKSNLLARELIQAKQILNHEFSKNTGVCIPVIKKYISNTHEEFLFKNNEVFLNDKKIGKLLKNERIFLSDGISFSYFNAIKFTTLF